MKNRFPESKRAKRIRELEERRLQKTQKPEVVRKSEVVSGRIDLDELWDSTDNTPTCPKCDSCSIYGHITEIKEGLAVVDWNCEACGHRWSSRCPFEDGCLTPVEVDGSWIGLLSVKREKK